MALSDSQIDAIFRAAYDELVAGSPSPLDWGQVASDDLTSDRDGQAGRRRWQKPSVALVAGAIFVMVAIGSLALLSPFGEEQVSTVSTDPPPSVPLPTASFSTYRVGDITYLRTACEEADPILRGGADGLPMEGQTEPSRVIRLVEENRSALLAEFDAVEVRAITRNGQVWTGTGQTVEAQDAQIEVVLGPEGRCPDSPYSWNGVPLVFSRQTTRLSTTTTTPAVSSTVPARVGGTWSHAPDHAVLGRNFPSIVWTALSTSCGEERNPAKRICTPLERR